MTDRSARHRTRPEHDACPGDAAATGKASLDEPAAAAAGIVGRGPAAVSADGIVGRFPAAASVAARSAIRLCASLRRSAVVVARVGGGGTLARFG